MNNPESSIHEKFKKLFRRLLLNCFPMLLFLTIWSGVAGQVTITTSSLPNGMVGVEYSSTGATLSASVTSPAVDVCWNVTGLPPGLNLSGGALGGCAATGTSVTIIGPPSVSGTYFPQFTATGLDASNNPVGTDDMATISIQIDPAAGTPVHVMMILDRSGSMTGTVPGLSITSYGSEITSDSKWNVLKIVCNDFLTEFDNLRDEPNDEIAIQFFNNSHSEFPGGFMNFNTLPISTSLNSAASGSLLEYMGQPGNQPTSMTCIGGAIQTGYGDFPGGVTHGNIIVFTDGLQNLDPSVSNTGTSIENKGISSGTGFDPNPPTLDLTSLSNVRIHTIHLGDNAASTLMNNVSVASGGEHFSIRNISGTETSTDQFNTFITSWDQTLVNSMEGLSPKIGKIVSGKTVSGAGSQKFIVDNKAEKILFKIVKYTPSSTGIIIRKDGKVVLKSTQRELIGHYRITLPMTKDIGVAMGGEWEVEISNAEIKSLPYYISLFIDEEALKFNTSLGGNTYVPGDTIPISVMMAYNDGKSTSVIPDADSVYAIVAKPGEDINDLFAQASIDITHDPNEPNQSPGERKFNELIQNSPEFRQALALADHFFPLTNNHDGTYTGNFMDTELSGIYRVGFFIRGEHADLGSYQRFEQVATIIDFGTADPGQTVFQHVVNDNLHQLVITPMNKFGHMIGPNRLGQININYQGKALSLRDQLDGTYVASLPATIDLSGQVSVKIKGSVFFDDRLSKVEGSGGQGTGITAICNWIENVIGIPCWLGLLIILVLIIIIIAIRRRSGSS